MSEEEVKSRLRMSNWLSRLSAKFADSPLQHYLPLRQELPTELDDYRGKYAKQDDFLFFKNMLKTENYAERKAVSQ